MTAMQREGDVREDYGFVVAIVFSLLLHAVGWSQLPRLMPKAPPVLPVQVLQVKLGMEDVENATKTYAASASVDHLVRTQLGSNTTLSERAARKLDKQVSTPKSLPQSLPEQFVRERKPVQQTLGKGAMLGNSQQSNINAITSYAQTLALWVQRFKSYPEKARAVGMEGDAVVRIRIDRQGNILYVSLRQKSGHAELDAAVLNMVDHANPVPPVPADYPVQDAYLEFLIPISFTLGKP